MDSIVIRGGRSLRGEVEVGGAKNASLPILFASLLTEESCHVDNVPRVVDCATTERLLAQLGVDVQPNSFGSVALAARRVTSLEAPYDLVKTMRASFLALGPLLARFGEARVATPGGCAIGSRPVNLHLVGLEKMGAEIATSHGYVEARAPRDGAGRPRLHGAHIALEMPSVGATENLMMAAALADGTTVIDNAAREPEIVDLAEVLAKMGAGVRGAGSPTIEIDGRDRLRGFAHRVIPDRIEAGTLVMAVAAAGGDVVVRGARADHLGAVLERLAEAGVGIEPGEGAIRVRSDRRLRSVDVLTAPYPGFPTDLQAQMMALMSTASGAAMITETIFENRFMHVPELSRMGANITVHGASAMVRGVKELTGAQVMATDLRASVSLVVAGLAA
ncbi:MAG TPA: UDP-N-acetylglucosamine 1-carboxyvinyltransferase, partial [Candidatus Binatia bacterium]|nr:UDP-N-acetylglucosamine 1-carboxyvinyltransferase [Candidatus Binatia bacterium]